MKKKKTTNFLCHPYAIFLSLNLNFFKINFFFYLKWKRQQQKKLNQTQNNKNENEKKETYWWRRCPDYFCGRIKWIKKMKQKIKKYIKFTYFYTKKIKEKKTKRKLSVKKKLKLKYDKTIVDYVIFFLQFIEKQRSYDCK